MSLDYYGDNLSNMVFYILKEGSNGIEYIDSASFNSINTMQHSYLIFNVKNDEIVYFGYFNGEGNGAINILLERYISEEFDILIDPNGNSVGSEVNLGYGNYGEDIIHQGFTRICYLGSNAPDRTSRLNYEWISSNPSIAMVSEYGTITAISPGYVKIYAVYKLDKTIVGTIAINVVTVPDTGIIRLNYGMDVRVGGTISGTEVTSGKGSAIAVYSSPSVSIHRGYTRLICLGDDSPNSSVQAFTWTAYREYNTDTGMVTVSQFGTITGTTSGWVTVKGVYKYNPNYEVYIRIYVE